jgi:DNA helicase-2/ATP-dependent DNA helicase PcrA
MQSHDSQTAALLADLNEPQRQAVQHRDGPLLVIAGPGSGKTRVITRRAAYLVHTGVPARNILAITFTNKAADEMKRRIEALGVAHGMWVYTFHALGVRLLREFGPLGGVQHGFTIYDEADALKVVKEALEICKVSDAVLKPDDARAKISDAKSKLLTPPQLLERAERFEHETAARVYEAYQQLLQQRNAVDFDDLLMRVAFVLRDHPDVTARLNVRFRYVLIDEYQDTNHAQYLIARHLSHDHGNICATGDPDQSIYAWRGADIRNILEFERDYPSAKVVRLEQNYRSVGHVLAIASRLIQRNRRRKHKDLWTRNPTGEPVQVWKFVDGRDEAEHIAQTIADNHQAGRPWSDFAIFYRINAVSRGLEEALRDREIPYKIARGVEFYNRKEIRDVLAYLRVLVNPADNVALERIINTPARGIGKTSIARLMTCARETGRPLRDIARTAAEVPGLGAAAKRVRAFSDLLDRLQPVLETTVSEAVSTVLAQSGLEKALQEERDTGGEDRLANVQELVTAAIRYEEEVDEPTLADFLSRISLTSDQDAVDENAGCVLLMTLHAAKGLEFPVVFLVGLEQGLLPHERSLAPGGQIEEERRLCFVGITRACERLFISHALERMIRGRPLPRPASQFLHEFDGDGLAWQDFQTNQPRPPPWRYREGFVPLVEDLPPEEAARLVPKRRLRAEPDFESCEEAAAEPRTTSQFPRGRRKPAPLPPPPATNPYADWGPGTLVQHERYGVGQVLWIRPAPGQTRAGLKFAGLGEKTLILELAPVRKLERGSR